MPTVGANTTEVERIAAEKAEVKYSVVLFCCTADLNLVVYEGDIPVFSDTECNIWNMVATD